MPKSKKQLQQVHTLLADKLHGAGDFSFPGKEHLHDSGTDDIGFSLEELELCTDLSSAYSDTDTCPSPRQQKSPFERYSLQSSQGIQQRARAASESFISPSHKGILKKCVDSPPDVGRKKTTSFCEAAFSRQKHVSFCETQNTIRIFSKERGLDEQAALRKKNEKKRRYKTRKASGSSDGGD